MAERVPGAYATRRVTGTDDECPLTDEPVDMGVCEPCRFFRGAVSAPGAGRQWSVLCNWPYNGSEVARMEKPGPDIPVPDVYRRQA